MKDKFLVIALLEHFSTPGWVIHYYKVDDTIRDVLAKFLVRNLEATEATLFEHLKNKILKENNSHLSYEIIQEELERRHKEIVHEINDYCSRWIYCESSGDGPLNFEVRYMTEEEFANPTGRIRSPYNECDNDLTFYPFYNPVTKELILNP